MLNRMIFQLFRQIRQKVFTNPFPVPQMPDSLTDALHAAEKGWINLNPPVEVNEHFRGRLNYDKTACIGCKLCIKVCPANATVFLPKEKKIQIHLDRCCFCAQCVEICPVKCLAMSGESLISSYDRKAQIVTDTGKISTGTALSNVAPEARTVYRVIEEKCIGCTKCARSCPVSCISGRVKEKHVIDESKCVGCGKCAEVCPKDAVELVEE